MPQVYGTYTADESNTSYDVMLMEFLDGLNAGKQDVSSLSEKARNLICENIVDNLISFHSKINKDGFGELFYKEFYPTWQDFYRPKAQKTVEKAKKLHSLGQISDFVLHIFEHSFENFEAKKCFYRLYAEVGHYHDANEKFKTEYAEQMARDLSEYL